VKLPSRLQAKGGASLPGGEASSLAAGLPHRQQS
jgi:hypothetical protein